MSGDFIIKGRGKIAAAIGKSARDIPMLVKRQHLPAFQETDDGPWFARADDLYIWSLWKADRFLPEDWGEIRAKYQHLVPLSHQGKGGG